MNKFLLTTVSVFALGVTSSAFASSAVILNNQATVTQSGNSQSADVNQTKGTQDTANVTQDDGAWPSYGTNTIAIVQGGTNNNALGGQSGYKNHAELNQWGQNGGASLTQVGQSNYSYVIQYANQAFDPQALLNDGQVANIAQYGDSNQVSSWQNGNRVKLYVYQGASDAASSNNQVVNQQDTADNTFTVYQLGDGTHYAWNSQQDQGFNSSGNQGYVYQTGYHQTAYNTQHGDTNQSNISQDGQYQTAYNVQTGSVGTVNITQHGSYNTATSNQGGSANYAGILQATGSSSNIAYSNQSGENGQSYITQYGTGNSAALNSQVGISNISQLYQSGSGNILNASQDGGSNRIYAWQYDVAHNADLSQIGSNNLISGNQSNGGTGVGNSAVVVQASSNNVASYNQTGTSQHANIHQ